MILTRFTEYVKGTAAHVVEPRLPGARDSYIDLGRYYDAARLEKRARELNELSARCSAAFKSAYSLLSAAGSLTERSSDTPDKEISGAAEECAALLECGKSDSPAQKRVFLNAFSCEGKIFLSGTMHSLCGEVYSINASARDAGRILRKLSEKASSAGLSAVICPSPLDPSLISHLMLPGCGVAFTSEPGAAGKQLLSIAKSETAEHIELYDALMGAAEKALVRAKKAHDMLEEIYNPCVDFEGVYAEAEAHIRLSF